MLTTAQQIEGWPQTVAQFERLVEATQDDLVNFAFHQLGNRDDAEDAVQDVYVQAFRERIQRKQVTEVRLYLFRMVRNRCIDHHRARLRHPVEPLIDRFASNEDAFSEVAEQEQAERLNQLLDGISKQQAEVIRLRVLSDLSFAVVAVVVGASLPAVKSRFRYGLDKLRRALQAKGGTR